MPWVKQELAQQAHAAARTGVCNPPALSVCTQSPHYSWIMRMPFVQDYRRIVTNGSTEVDPRQRQGRGFQSRLLSVIRI